MASLSSFASNFSHLLLGTVGKVPGVGAVVGGGGGGGLALMVSFMLGVGGTPMGGMTTLRRDFADLLLWAVGKVAWVGFVGGHVGYLI